MPKDFYVSYEDLDQYQEALLLGKSNKSQIVSGCAGSGKSVIALHKAKKILDDNKGSCQIVVYTKALNNYMNNGKVSLGLNCKFEYYDKWKKGALPTDYIIVDEIQDFTEEEVERLKSKATKHFFFFGDTAQSLYSGLKQTLSIEQISEKYKVSTDQRKRLGDYAF